MVTKRRKSDFWMMPGVVVSLLSILGIIVGGSMWVQATNDEIGKMRPVASCVNDMKIEQEKIKTKIEALDRKVEKMDRRQEKKLDKISEQQRELQQLMIEIIRQNGGD